MSRVLFFGDSFTAGENSLYNFTSKLYDLGTTFNLGVSGTTIGDYSIFPVYNSCLLDVVERHKTMVETADIIFLEYAINDTTAVMCDFTTSRVVLVSFVKALDAIKQINPSAKIYFLTVSHNDYVLENLATNMCNYLTNDYFSGFEECVVPATMWLRIYKNLIQSISNKCEVLEMIQDENFFSKYLSDDGVHPTKEGHNEIAKTILAQLK